MLLFWASFAHGQNYEMHGFCWDEIHRPLEDQPKFGERGRTEPGSCSGQENRHDERCSNRVVQSDPDSLHELHLPGWSNITNGLLEHVAGTGGATKESEHAQVIVTVCLLELANDETRSSGELTGKVLIASGGHNTCVP